MDSDIDNRECSVLAEVEKHKNAVKKIEGIFAVQILRSKKFWAILWAALWIILNKTSHHPD